MHLDTIAALLSKRVGFDAKIVSDRKIARAVETRKVACDLADVDAYLKVLQTSPQEFNELVEQLVVSETWFFRDRKPFDFLVNFVRSEWLLKPNATKLRVLSVPCSTGEEPYSIAIALLEAGLPVNRFSIDAIDISSLAIAKAQRAIYGKNSFRGEDWVERSRYFQPVTEQRGTDKYELCPLVRQAVNIRQGNLLDLIAETHLKYDIIFCRNLLIYLEDSACQQILNTLHCLLSSQGLLFVGASETGKVSGDRFSYLRQSFTFAYRKLDTVSLQSPAANSEQTKSDLLVATSIQKAKTSKKRKVTASSHCPSSTILTSSPIAISATSTPLDSDIQQAKALADAGHLTAAIDRCKAYLECHFTNAEAYTLLGTLYQATASYEQAGCCFQKALYLQPHHYEALMHFALLKESRGDVIGAERLKQRIQKLQPNS